MNGKNKIPVRIVGEICKNYPAKENMDLLSSRFETIIAANAARGYALESWQLSSVVDQRKHLISETIIAVFVKVDL